MFSKNPYALTQYSFKARSNKIIPVSGKPNMPHRWIKAKFDDDVWIGEAGWFNMGKCDGWEYVSGRDDIATSIVSRTEFSAAWAENDDEKQSIIEGGKRELAYTLDRADNIDTEERYNEIRYERKDRLRRMQR